MTRYNKGANAERELIRRFWERGFAVARIAGSGKSSLPMPDIIALSRNRVILLEVKAWRNSTLTILEGQMHELFKWRDISNAEVFVAWKYPNRGWFFVKPESFKKAKNYSISIKDCQRLGSTLEDFIGSQKQLLV